MTAKTTTTTTTPPDSVVPFSCDLVEQSKRHLLFLRELHALGVTLRCSTRTHLHRYLHHWLPLVYANNNTKLIPPPDVAFLWHCHRLAPASYERYCTRRFGGTILEACPPFCFQRPPQAEHDKHKSDDNDDIQAAQDHTRHLWQESFPGVPFFWNETDDQPSIPQATTSSSSCGGTVDGFDLVASTACQAGFLWQVSHPNFQDDAFLQQGVVRYHQFLTLPQTTDNCPLVPTYQIDIVWHTHMLYNTTLYNDDCKRIRGGKFHHDDSLNDRTPNGTLDVAFSQTKAVWEATYQVPYEVPGGMYRGEPPSVFYDHTLWNANMGYDAGDQVIIRVAGSSSSGSDVYVWQFLDNSGWTDFDPPHQGTLESAFMKYTSSQSGIVMYSLGQWQYNVDVVNMTQTNTGTKKKRDIRRSTVGDQVVWEVNTDSGWQPYDTAQQVSLEQAYVGLSAQPSTKVVLYTTNWQYEVDVKAMTQTNISHKDRKQRPVRRQVKRAEPWVDPLPNDFIPASAKSTRRGVNSNAKRDGMVFGKGSAGIGYYSMNTKDSYQIMYLRLKKREQHARSQLENYDCSKCLCCGCTPSMTDVRNKERLAQEWQEYRHQAAAVQAKWMGSGPSINPDKASVEKYLEKPRNTSRSNYDYYYGPYTYVPYTDYHGVCTAAGCGAGADGCAAGCGGGACGGGACGGGGGGCGGGGCGGGGGGCGGGGGG